MARNIRVKLILCNRFEELDVTNELLQEAEVVIISRFNFRNGRALEIRNLPEGWRIEAQYRDEQMATAVLTNDVSVDAGVKGFKTFVLKSDNVSNGHLVEMKLISTTLQVISTTLQVILLNLETGHVESYMKKIIREQRQNFISNPFVMAELFGQTFSSDQAGIDAREGGLVFFDALNPIQLEFDGKDVLSQAELLQAKRGDELAQLMESVKLFRDLRELPLTFQPFISQDNGKLKVCYPLRVTFNKCDSFRLVRYEAPNSPDLVEANALWRVPNVPLQ